MKHVEHSFILPYYVWVSEYTIIYYPFFWRVSTWVICTMKSVTTKYQYTSYGKHMYTFLFRIYLGGELRGHGA